MVNYGEFLKPETCGQTLLPDNAKLDNNSLQHFKEFAT